MGRIFGRLAVGAMVSIGLVVAGAGAPAGAASVKKKPTASSGIVTATSIRSLEKISGPVRTTRLGSEVRLPSGTWIDCRGDCRETLRASTVDFWEHPETRAKNN